MRFIARVPSFRQPSQLIRPGSFRPLSSSQPFRLREDKAQDPQEVEKAKQEQMRTGEKKGELQSSSEQAVGADQQKVKDHDAHINELQKQTAQQKEKEHPEGKS